MFGAATVRRPAEGRSGVRAYDDMFLIEAHLWRYAAYRAYVGLLSEASRYYLGWLWWLLEPLAMTSVFFFVFTYLRAPNAENFQYFLIIGVTTWLWFANAVANCTESLPGAKTIVSTMRLPKLLFPFATVISASLKHAFVFTTILIVMGAVFGTSPAWLYLPVLLFTQLSLIMACSSCVAFVCCWVRDVRLIVRSGLTLMMFCSGIFFAIDSMPPAYQEVLRLNPMAILIEDYRQVLIDSAVPEVSRCAWIASLSMLFLLAMKRLYRRFDLALTRRVLA